MTRLQLATWLFPTAVCVCLSGIYFFEWHSSRAEQRQASAVFAETVRALNGKLVFESVQTRSSLKVLREGMDGLASRLDKFSSAPSTKPETTNLAETHQGTTALVQDEPVDAPAEPAPSPLPQGVNPIHFVQTLDLRKFFDNPDFNTGQTDLEPVDKQRAVNVLDRAQARLIELRSDIHLLEVEESRKMLEEGLYVDYESGQKRLVEKGVHTMGEPLPGGVMRIYSFRPEEYPRLYEMKKEMTTVSEDAVRRLMALAAKQ